MEGYEVLTSDDRKVGRVTEIQDDNLIIEHGHLLKSRHAMPKVLARDAGPHGRQIIPADPHEGP